jgi:ABC-type multidrug transport system fused ATPase/permease subunit
MDDPISALDANVKKNVFKHVLKGQMADKTRILVTHAVEYLYYVDRIIIMEGGRVKTSGAFEELWESEDLHLTLKRIEKTRGEKALIKLDEDLNLEYEESPTTPINVHELSATSPMRGTRNQRKNHMAIEGSHIMKDEEDEIIDVKWNVYFEYLWTSGTWAVLLFVTFPLTLFGSYLWMRLIEIIADWVNAVAESHHDAAFRKYFWLYVGSMILCLITTSICFFAIWIHAVWVSNMYFKKMAQKIIKAPINQYFDKTPSGWILNWFSKDVVVTDLDLSHSVFHPFECGSSLVELHIGS